MIIRAWRIYKPQHAATNFSGEGARRFGGRFNSKGVAVVYAASSISLASLEMLVHLQAADVLLRYALRPIEFNESLLKRLDPRRLPRNWRKNPPPMAVQRIGDRWALSGDSAVLEVPSAIVSTESNYLINPLHPDFARINIGRQRPFRLESRLLKS